MPSRRRDLNQFRGHGDKLAGSGAVELASVFWGSHAHATHSSCKYRFALSLVPVGALAQAENEPSATFNERYPQSRRSRKRLSSSRAMGKPTGTAQQKKPPEQLPSNAPPTGTAQQKT